MQKQMQKQQAGFTLIELVMVIVILGILAAFALPKFADLTGDAREASINGLAGALKSAASIARAQQLVDQGALGDTVSLDGSSITMVSGYPTADAAGIGIAASVSAGAPGADNVDYEFTGGSSAEGGSITYNIPGFAGTCTVEYTAASGATSISAPYDVTVDVTGC